MLSGRDIILVSYSGADDSSVHPLISTLLQPLADDLCSALGAENVLAAVGIDGL